MSLYTKIWFSLAFKMELVTNKTHDLKYNVHMYLATTLKKEL